MKKETFLFISILMFITSHALADTVILKDKSILKGVVVEDYADRIIFSTYEGEKSIIKKDIDYIEYDSLEYNVLDLAALHRDKKEFQKAYNYYEKALDLNPESEVAKDGLIFSAYAVSKEEQCLYEKEIEKKKIIEEFRSTGAFQRRLSEDKEGILKNSVGILFKIEGANPEVTEVVGDSPADKAGIKAGDKIVAIWSRLAGYLDNDDVFSRLTEPKQAELRLTIERKLKVAKEAMPSKSIYSLIGVKFGIEYEGTVAKKILKGGSAYIAGMKKGDLIIEVRDEPTRYMDLKSMNTLIRETSQEVDFVIRRKVIIWKKRM